MYTDEEFQSILDTIRNWDESDMRAKMQRPKDTESNRPGTPMTRLLDNVLNQRPLIFMFVEKFFNVKFKPVVKPVTHNTNTKQWNISFYLECVYLGEYPIPAREFEQLSTILKELKTYDYIHNTNIHNQR